MSIGCKRKNRGLALIVVLFALLVLSTIAGGLVVMSSGHLSHAQNSGQSLEAIYAARAGISMKLAQVRSGNFDPIATTAMPSQATYAATAVQGDGVLPFPPEGTIYVEAEGTSRGGKTRRIGVLASISESRWNHAAFGNNSVVMKSGSYTDSFNSDGGPVNHARASIGTNNRRRGVQIEDSESVIIGWKAAFVAGRPQGRKPKGRSKSLDKLEALANVQGPPGSSERVAIVGSQADRSYKNFVNASSEADMSPVVMPNVAAGLVGAVDDPAVSNLNSIHATTPTTIPPGAYHDLTVTGAGSAAILDVSTETPGSEVTYVFNSINLNEGQLSIVQPPPPAQPVTVKIYVDTGDGTDPTKGVFMTGSSIINPSQKPINLQLFIAGKGTSTLEGFDELKDGGATAIPRAFYVAYAPEANVSISRGQVYGAVVANNVTLDGDGLSALRAEAPAVIHFDMALLNDRSNPPMINVLSTRNF